MKLYDSDTAEEVTAGELHITSAEYDALIVESMESSTAEGHVRTSTGRRVYAAE
jgi:hypothetical protein